MLVGKSGPIKMFEQRNTFLGSSGKTVFPGLRSKRHFLPYAENIKLPGVSKQIPKVDLIQQILMECQAWCFVLNNLTLEQNSMKEIL